MTVAELWRSLAAWRGRRRARRRAQRQQSRERQLALWGGPVEAGRVLAFSDAVFAIAITLLTINLEVPSGLHGAAFVTALHQLLPALGAYALSFLILGQLWLAHHRIFGVIARVDYVVLRSNLLFLGLIALMPFPVRLLSDYSDRPLAVAVYAVAFIAAMVLQLVIWLAVTRPERGDLLSDYSDRPLAVAIYAVAFIAAMALQLVIWLDVTRPERADLLSAPVPDEVRTGFGRALSGMLVVFGAIMPLGMFAPRYAALVWALMIPLRLVVARFAHRFERDSD